jgi:RNA polymerase sigma-70 factor (ECF subfamily)
MPASSSAAVTAHPAPGAPPLVDERTLVVRAQGGDSAAFDQLVRHHLARAVRVARRITRSLEDAEDVVQEAFVAAHGALRTFDATRPFAPWLLRIVANRASSLTRSQRRRPQEPLTDLLASAMPSPLADAERAETRARLAAAVAALPERQRTIIQLFEVDGFSSSEIGDMLGVAEGTVRWHVHAARRALRAALAPYRHIDDGGSDGS